MRRNREAQARHRQRRAATVSVPPSDVRRTHTDSEGDVCPALTLDEYEGRVSEVARWARGLAHMTREGIPADVTADIASGYIERLEVASADIEVARKALLKRKGRGAA